LPGSPYYAPLFRIGEAYPGEWFMVDQVVWDPYDSKHFVVTSYRGTRAYIWVAAFCPN
jgi:hypothetical protein